LAVHRPVALVHRDAGRDPSDPEDNFGLVTVDYVPKEPALSAFEAVVGG
jgi:hypothetical protein